MPLRCMTIIKETNSSQHNYMYKYSVTTSENNCDVTLVPSILTETVLSHIGPLGQMSLIGCWTLGRNNF